MSLKHRVNKLEEDITANDNPVTEIRKHYVNPDGSVSGIVMVKVTDGVWHMQKNDFQFTDKEGM